MGSVTVKAGAVEPLTIAVRKASDGTPLTGSTNLRVSIRRTTDNRFLDFADGAFKTSGWTTRQATLTEIDSTNAAGWYEYVTGGGVHGIDTTGWNAVPYDVAFEEVTSTLAQGAPQIGFGEIRVGGSIENLDGRVPASLVSGRMDASVGAVQSGAIGAAGFAAGAITSTVLADDAITAAKIAADAIGSSELAASAANEIADALLDRALSGHTTTGTAGAALANADVATSTRAAPGAAMDLVDDAVDAGALAASAVTEIQSGLATSSALTSVASAVASLPSASDNATATAAAVVDQTLSGHTTSGTVGEALARVDTTVSSRSTLTASQIWATALPAGFLSGSAGYLVGTYLDAAISSRLAGASYSAPPSASAIASQVLGTSVPGAFASGTLGYVIGTNLDAVLSTRLAASSYTAPASVGAIADAVWDEAISGHLTTGTTGKHLNDILVPTVGQVAAEVWATAEGTPDEGTFGYGLKILRQGLTNRLESTAGNPGLLKLYADDATTLLLTWQLRDKDGGAVTATSGEPTKRGAGA